MSSLLESTQHLSEQVALINGLDSSKAGPLLKRVIARLAEKNAAAFNEAEQAKLCALFRIEARQLTDVLETAGYIFEQAAFAGAAPETLTNELAAVGMKGEWSAAFVEVWTAAGPDLRHALVDRSVCAKRLDHIDWRLQMQLGQQDLTRIKKTNVVLALTTRDQDHGGKLETSSIEFTHEQLAFFLQQLDRIQEQMDALG